MALIGKNKEEAQELAAKLSNAVDRGLVAQVDECALSLLELSETKSRIVLSETEWRAFLKTVRKAIPVFVSTYIMVSKYIESALVSGLSEPCATIRALLEEAKAKDAWILELPIEEEGVSDV
jgi:hypothetical protein